jgi:hypothetical protein
VDDALDAAWQALTPDTGLLVPEAAGMQKLPLSALAFMPTWLFVILRR